MKYLTALFNNSVTSCQIPSIWKSSQSRNQARTPFSALLIGLSGFSVQQRKLWWLSCFQPSTATCFHPQTNTVSDPDTLPLLLYYNWRMLSRQVSTKGNLHIVQSVSLLPDGGIRYSQPQRTVIKDCKINTAGGDLSIAVKLLKRQTISY